MDSCWLAYSVITAEQDSIEERCDRYLTLLHVAEKDLSTGATFLWSGWEGKTGPLWFSNFVGTSPRLFYFWTLKSVALIGIGWFGMFNLYQPRLWELADGPNPEARSCLLAASIILRVSKEKGLWSFCSSTFPRLDIWSGRSVFCVYIFAGFWKRISRP